MKKPDCAGCGVKREEKACMIKEGKAPKEFCPTRDMPGLIEEVNKLYNKEEIYEFARQASIQEAEGYANRDEEADVIHPVKPRLQEISEFADRMGYKRLGLAYCVGLQFEAGRLARFLEKQGFEVVSVICKVGCTPKEALELTENQKIREGRFETMCSPLAQAEILNNSETDFNVLLGLCVGHDSLFMKQSKAFTTVFAVKDRLLGHNPLAALYTLHSYYQRFDK